MDHTPRNYFRWLFDVGLRPAQSLRAPLDLSPRARGDLLLGLPRPAIPDQGPDRPAAESYPPQHFSPLSRHESGGASRFWYAPTLFWLSSGSHCGDGHRLDRPRSPPSPPSSTLAAPQLLPLLRLLPLVRRRRQDFSGYQSDGMLLEAGFLALFFAPAGLLPGWGADSPPPRASLFLLAVGVVPHLLRIRHGQAAQRRSRNGATSPRWTSTTRTARCPPGSAGTSSICPHWFHVATAGGTLCMELGHRLDALPPAPLAPHLLLHRHAMGDRRHPHRQLHLPQLPRARPRLSAARRPQPPLALFPRRFRRTARVRRRTRSRRQSADRSSPSTRAQTPPTPNSNRRRSPSCAHAAHSRRHAPRRRRRPAHLGRLRHHRGNARACLWPDLPSAHAPIVALEPFRIANQYGLFAVMTRGRYEIEFQGSNDGQNWTAYPFRYKPQALNEAPAHLRALPAALRLEPVVRLARRLAAEPTSFPSPKSACSTTTPMSLSLPRQSLPATLRRATCVPSSGNTGSLRWTKNAAPATGGVASSSASTRPSSPAIPAANSPPSSGPTNSRPTTKAAGIKTNTAKRAAFHSHLARRSLALLAPVSRFSLNASR